jgi:hypothetical protein
MCGSKNVFKSSFYTVIIVFSFKIYQRPKDITKDTKESIFWILQKIFKQKPVERNLQFHKKDKIRLYKEFFIHLFQTFIIFQHSSNI